MQQLCEKSSVNFNINTTMETFLHQGLTLSFVQILVCLGLSCPLSLYQKAQGEFFPVEQWSSFCSDVSQAVLYLRR